MIAFDKRRIRLALLLAATALLFATSALMLPAAAAQEEAKPQADTEATTETAAAPAPRPRGCDDEAYRQFDFWVGEWNVVSWDGKEVPQKPVNRIEKILGGCGLRESYSSPPDYTGTSITFYDRFDQRWHQTWLASDGTPLYLVGGLVDGKMVLEDDPQDDRPKSRITWEPLEGGDVRQTWKLSRDGGETWDTVFDGRYVPMEDGGM